MEVQYFLCQFHYVRIIGKVIYQKSAIWLQNIQYTLQKWQIAMLIAIYRPYVIFLSGHTEGCRGFLASCKLQICT